MPRISKFLGVCILLAAVIISATLLYTNKEPRYKVAGSRVFNTEEGKFVTEVSVPPPTTNSNNKDQVTDSSDIPIKLGDLSKFKIVGDVSDNSYLYKIDCTVKNEDSIGNKVYIKATLFDKNGKPINTIESSPKLIFPNQTETFNLQTDDYSMTSKYKSYTLEVIQSKYLSYTDKLSIQNGK